MSAQNDKMLKTSIHLMESMEKWGYISTGLSFLVIGMGVFANGWLAFFMGLHQGLLKSAMMLMVDLLLVVIFLELFRTLLEFLKTHTLNLEPFFYIGVVAAIRRILTLTAQEAITHASPEQFNRYLWDIGLHGFLVLGLVISSLIYKKQT